MRADRDRSGAMPSRFIVSLVAATMLAAAAFSGPALPMSAGIAGAAPKPPLPCQSAFPGARSKTIGKTTWWNRQESMRQVLCNRFGLDPSADFPISAGMVCSVLSQVIGGASRNLSLYVDGSCSGADIASSPKEPVRYISALCGWASDLLEIARPQIGKLASAGCTLAPSAGTGLGAAFESKHELDVAVDVVSHNKCIKYSPTHFGSPWIAEACAAGDNGFKTLPVQRQGPSSGEGGGDGPAPPGSGGSSGSGSGGGGPGGGGPATTIYHSSAEGPYGGPPPQTNKPESPLLSVGYDYGCAIAVSKAVRCFGGNLEFFDAAAVAGSFQQVSVGGVASCGVRTDSTLACWGWVRPGDPQASMGPPPTGSFRAVSVGLTHACAVDTQYILTCWGNEDDAAVVPDPGRYTEVSAGWDYTCGLHVDGTIACWGTAPYEGNAAQTPSGTFREVSVGEGEACGLTYLNEVTCWGGLNGHAETHPGPFTEIDTIDGWSCGRQASGELSCFGPANSYSPDYGFAPRAGNYSDVSIGRPGACGRHEDGSVTCWGGAFSGQVTPAAGPFTQLMAGRFYSCGLRPDQSVACWGNTDGEASQQLTGSYLQISGGGRLGSIETLCGIRTDHTLFCHDGTTPLAGSYEEVAAAEYDGCAIAAGSGSVSCWSNGLGPTPAPPAGSFTQISGGGFGPWSRYCALRTDRTVACWQSGEPPLAFAPPPAGQFTKVVVGAYETDCGIRIDGTLACWKPPEYAGPSSPPAGAFVDVAVAAQAACAIRTDGSIVCWGWDDYEEMNHPAGNNFTQIVAGENHMCARRADGSVACWGHGDVLAAG